MEEDVVVPEEVVVTCDLDYYIKAVGEAEARSKPLWKSVYKHIGVILEDSKKKHRPMLDIADILLEEVGEQMKNEPVCLSAYRVVAQAILTRQKVTLP